MTTPPAPITSDESWVDLRMPIRRLIQGAPRLEHDDAGEEHGREQPDRQRDVELLIDLCAGGPTTPAAYPVPAPSRTVPSAAAG